METKKEAHGTAAALGAGGHRTLLLCSTMWDCVRDGTHD